jgi:hypothetical protein
MFVTDDTIKVTLYYRQISNGNIKIESSLDEVPEGKRDKYQALDVELKPMTWHTFNALQQKCTKNMGPGMGEELDWVRYKEEKLQVVLVKWSAVDKDGKPIPVTKDAIFRLHPRVAETILNEYDKITLLGEEEKKN